MADFGAGHAHRPAGAGGGRRDAGHLDRPFHRADPDAGPQHPDRSDLVRTRLALLLRPARNACARPASASTICQRSTSSCSATIITTIWTSDAQAAVGPRPADIITSLGNDTILREAGIGVDMARPPSAAGVRALDWGQGFMAFGLCETGEPCPGTIARYRAAQPSLVVALWAPTATGRSGRPSWSASRAATIFFAGDTG